MPRLTKRKVDSLEPRERQYTVWDSQLRGFGVLVNVSGQKSYVARYRTEDGRDRRMVIGRHGEFTPKQARDRVAEVLREARVGGDPIAEKREAREAPTVGDLAERFCAEELPKRKPTTAAEYRRILDTYVLPELGSRKVSAVTVNDVSKLHRKLRASPFMANRALALVRSLFNLAERWEDRPQNTNPAVHVERYRERARETFLRESDFKALGEALAEVEGESSLNWLQCQAIRVLALTGARRSEVLGLERDWIDWERGVARLPDSKTGEKPLRLGPDALAVLRGIPKRGKFFFPSRTKRGAPMREVRKTWTKVKDRAGLPAKLRIHDLRHSKASLAAAQGLSLPMIGELLGHRSSSSTARYTHLVDDHIREAENGVQGAIGEAFRGKSE